MKPVRVYLASLSILLFGAVAYQCSTVQRENKERSKKITAFLDQFEKNLNEADLVILAQFRVEKSSEVLMKSIRIMQNIDKDKDGVQCLTDFKAANISFDDNQMRVEIPAIHRSLNDSIPLEKQTKLTMLLEPQNDDLVITKFNADEFYNSYQSLVSELRYKKIMAREIASKKVFFDQASVLQEHYDSVVWYSRYGDSTYYYVVNGKWRNYFLEKEGKRPDSCFMGIVSETGRVVVPPSFDLIGTIGFNEPDVIEVKKNGHVGLYHLSGKELAPAQFDFVVPYNQNNVNALVKQDSLFGWLDRSYMYHAGFPDKGAENYIKRFGYLSNHVTIDANSQATARILHPDHISFGIVIPSSYLVIAGVVQELVPYINIGDSEVNWGGTGYIKTEGSVFEKITDKLSALVVKIKTQYVEGRQEFYQNNNLTFVDSQNRPIQNFSVEAGEISFNQIDSTLLEMRMSTSPEGNSFAMAGYDREWNPTHYDYFKFTNDKKSIEQLKSKRRFNFTEFVKMDSSYIYGHFAFWNNESQSKETADRLCDETLKEIRNEILAWYGYDFDDKKIRAHFKYQDWYVPRYFHYESFLDKMTPIDRHNLEFLETFIGTLRTPGSS